MIVKFIKNIRSLFERKYLGQQIFKQELLLRAALLELNIDYKMLDIKCDHYEGKNYVNGVKLDIKYPVSFFKKCDKIYNRNKEYTFYFNGNMQNSGKRKELLQPYFNLKESLIIESDVGRIHEKKAIFNEDYFLPFTISKFGLCPHQMDWPGPVEYNWTYRFIESCMAYAIPVIFEKAPLSDEFIRDFHYLKSESILANLNELYFDEGEALHNRKLSFQKHTISSTELDLIKRTL